jgi:hypothetical protein
VGGDGSSARVVVPQYSYPSFGGTMSVVEEVCVCVCVCVCV